MRSFSILNNTNILGSLSITWNVVGANISFHVFSSFVNTAGWGSCVNLIGRKVERESEVVVGE